MRWLAIAATCLQVGLGVISFKWALFQPMEATSLLALQVGAFLVVNALRELSRLSDELDRSWVRSRADKDK